MAEAVEVAALSHLTTNAASLNTSYPMRRWDSLYAFFEYGTNCVHRTGVKPYDVPGKSKHSSKTLLASNGHSNNPRTEKRLRWANSIHMAGTRTSNICQT
jgi:hypothetical protein